MNDFSHEYGVYGLALRSNRAMDGFARADENAPRVTIDFAGAPQDDAPSSLKEAPFYTNGFETLWHRRDGSWLLRYLDERDGSFWTTEYDSGGTHLTIRWTAESLLDDIPAVLQGPGLAAALHLRGIPMLHASVLAVDGGAIALLGAPGAGKSTTAAAFVANGFASMSDDLAALAIDGTSVLVQPGYPRLRAFADSARAAGFEPDDLPRVFSAEVLGPKRYVTLSHENGTFQPHALPLRAIYYLLPRTAGGNGAPAIESLSTRQALPVLLQNLYSTRFLDAERRVTLIRTFAGLAATVAVRTVQANDDLAALPHLVDAIAADASRIGRTS
ncbi:MAG TPA: hypothetical protein VF911_01910 [Thermoanaerobaculia bacterium]|jgi:hypothetical protein